MNIRPYPRSWPRNLSFDTLTSLQVTLDPDLQLFYFRGTVSVTRKGRQVAPIKERKISTKLGGQITRTPHDRTRNTIAYGNTNPSREAIWTPKEIWDDVTSTIPDESPELVNKERGFLSKIPPEIQELDTLQGYDCLFCSEVARPNYWRVYRRMIGLPVRNAVKMFTNELVENEIVKYADLSKITGRMKSIFKTEWIVPDGHGSESWRKLVKYEPNHQFPDQIQKIAMALTKDKFWQDTGFPISWRVNHQMGEFMVYSLLKRSHETSQNVLVAI